MRRPGTHRWHPPEHFHTTMDVLPIGIRGCNRTPVNISSDEFDEILSIASTIYETPTEASLDFLIDETEKWCKERAVYLALLSLFQSMMAR